MSNAIFTSPVNTKTNKKFIYLQVWFDDFENATNNVAVEVENNVAVEIGCD